MVCLANNIFYFSRMKKIITSLLLASLLMSCGNKKKTYNDNLGIPDRVEFKEKENENYIQFPYTPIFMAMPEGYELNASTDKPRVRKNKQIFIDVTEQLNNRGVDEVKEAYERTVDEIKEKKPNAICLIKDFKFGNYDARYIFVGNYLPNNNKATFIFGDEKFAIVMGASFVNEIGLQKEIMDILLTTRLKPDANTNDPSPFAKYTIDLSGTKLKFNSFKTKDAHIYTDNGYDVEVGSKNNFVIMQFADGTKTTTAEKKETATLIGDKTKDDGSTITARQEKFVSLKNGEAYEVVLDKTYVVENKTMNVKSYLLCFDVEGQTFLLTSFIFKDSDSTIATYRHIVETMKLK